MTPKRSSHFFRVRDIISLFIQMGCEFRTVEANTTDDSGDTSGFGYLFNPTNDAFVAVIDLGDDDRIPEGEVADWQRVLDVRIPLPDDPD